MTCALITNAWMPQPAHANGWLESRSWQFETSADKANQSAVLDMIERKKGGYYDGFSTTVNNYSNTNIGTQVNCNNVADATGNIATNSQTANSPQVSNTSGVTSGATGNEAQNGTSGSDTAGNGLGNDQNNSGNVSSGVAGSNSSSSSGAMNIGSSDQDLSNSQTNTGNQTASITDSTACAMAGATLNGEVQSNITGPLN
ncbi:hypothetical protein [Pseudotabrizicola alkalilacus]|nr:hypothetical protein [Pseudotabrizicola alkalilacus]